jgi:hypothetical protein
MDAGWGLRLLVEALGKRRGGAAQAFWPSLLFLLTKTFTSVILNITRLKAGITENHEG